MRGPWRSGRGGCTGGACPLRPLGCGSIGRRSPVFRLLPTRRGRVQDRSGFHSRIPRNSSAPRQRIEREGNADGTPDEALASDNFFFIRVFFGRLFGLSFIAKEFIVRADEEQMVG